MEISRWSREARALPPDQHTEGDCSPAGPRGNGVSHQSALWHPLLGACFIGTVSDGMRSCPSRKPTGHSLAVSPERRAIGESNRCLLYVTRVHSRHLSRLRLEWRTVIRGGGDCTGQVAVSPEASEISGLLHLWFRYMNISRYEQKTAIERL